MPKHGKTGREIVEAANRSARDVPRSDSKDNSRKGRRGSVVKSGKSRKGGRR